MRKNAKKMRKMRKRKRYLCLVCVHISHHQELTAPETLASENTSGATVVTPSNQRHFLTNASSNSNIKVVEMSPVITSTKFLYSISKLKKNNNNNSNLEQQISFCGAAWPPAPIISKNSIRGCWRHRGLINPFDSTADRWRWRRGPLPLAFPADSPASFDPSGPTATDGSTTRVIHPPPPGLVVACWCHPALMAPLSGGVGEWPHSPLAPASEWVGLPLSGWLRGGTQLSSQLFAGKFNFQPFDDSCHGNRLHYTFTCSF